jgi:voltage-gated potassium channel
LSLRRQLIFSLLLLLVAVLSAVAVYMWLGGPGVTLLDAVYMAVITITTVGYGEIVDTHANPALRLFNIFFILIGIGIMLYVFSVSTAFIVEGELNDFFRRRKMMKQIREMNDHLVICGAGETGTYLVKELLKTGDLFVVIDHDEEQVERMKQLGDFPVIKGEASDENVLATARIHHARALASVLPEDKDNLLITVTARLLNPNLRIVARCADSRMIEKLLRHGANSAISPNMIGGMRLASELIRPSVVSFLDVMLRDQAGTMRVEEIPVAEGSTWIGKRLKEVAMQDRYNLLPLAIRKSEGEVKFNPREDTVVAKGDVVVVMGEVANVWKARDSAGSKIPHRQV